MNISLCTICCDRTRKQYLIELNITQLFAFPHFGIKRGDKIFTIFTLNSTKHIVYGY